RAAPAVAEEFERIDADRAWAGILRTRGDRVARLAEMPPASDAASALLRIALQGGDPVVMLPADTIAGGRWRRRVDAVPDAAAERRWI
ncbi:hypothetical protein, partial [Salmonella enterica]|uniref:hypothetical protein n=1 Tax=Salmonella enterica TaxID=28901 RepID=UPI0019D54EC5